MHFDELCALVGALRDRVAELEAKEAARAEREVVATNMAADLHGCWRSLDGVAVLQRRIPGDKAFPPPGLRFTPPGAEQVKSWPKF